MAFLGTTEVIAIHGDLPSLWLPIAASQTLVPGDLVYLVSGQVTKWIAPGADGVSTTAAFGVIDSNTTKTVNGISTSIAAGSLVKVIPFTRNVLLNLPSFGTAPTAALLGNGSSYTIRNNNGQYSINLSNSTNGVVKAVSFDTMDSRASGPGGPQAWKSSWAIGDRVLCSVIPGAKQIDF